MECVFLFMIVFKSNFCVFEVIMINYCQMILSNASVNRLGRASGFLFLSLFNNRYNHPTAL